MSSKSMHEIKRIKWNRMRLIIRILKESSLSFDRIFQSMIQTKLINDNTAGKRTIQNYLEELCAIEILRFDRISGVYKLAGNEPQVFESKHDYQIALLHSKALLFSSEKENTQRLDNINPNLFIDLLTYEPERDSDDFAVLQHLKTGYSEIYELLRNYKCLMDETGLSKRACLPKIGVGNFEQSWDFSKNIQSKTTAISGKTTPKNSEGMIEFNSGTLGSQETIGRVSESKLKEIQEIREIIVGKICGQVLAVVKNGTPLKGKCDFCPNVRVKASNDK